MSIRQMSKVWEHEFSGPDQQIMLALADHADDDGGSIFPSLARVAWKIGRHRDTVKRHIKALREAGVLIQVRYADGASQRPAEYRINWAAATPKPPFRPPEGSPEDDSLGGPEAGETPRVQNAPRVQERTPPGGTAAPPPGAVAHPPRVQQCPPNHQSTVSTTIRRTTTPPASSSEPASTPGEAWGGEAFRNENALQALKREHPDIHALFEKISKAKGIGYRVRLAQAEPLRAAVLSHGPDAVASAMRFVLDRIADTASPFGRVLHQLNSEPSRGSAGRPARSMVSSIGAGYDFGD